MAGKALWLKTTLSVAGTSLNSLVSSPMMDPAYRPIILAGGDGSPLFGYAPGAGNAGFRVRTVAMPENAAAVVNDMLNPDGVPVAIQYADAGGAHVALAFCHDVSVGVSGQGEAEINAQFATVEVPTVGGTVAPSSVRGLPWRINDLTSVTMPDGTELTKLAGVTFRIQRPLSEFRGNSPFGLPQDLATPYTLVTLDVQFEKLDDSQEIAAATLPRAIADAKILFTQVDAASPKTLTLTCKKAFITKWPDPQGNVADFMQLTGSLASEVGDFAVA